MNRLFITLYAACLVAIVFAVASCTLILWVQWQPEYNYQLRRFTTPTLKQLHHQLRSELNQPTPNPIIEFTDQQGRVLRLLKQELLTLRRLSHETGQLLALPYTKDLFFTESEQEALNSGQAVYRSQDAEHQAYLSYDHERVLEMEFSSKHERGKLWLSGFLYTFYQPDLTLQDKLQRTKGLLNADEVPLIKPLSESNLTRLEVSRLLVAPRMSPYWFLSQYQVRAIHLPLSDHSAPQLIDTTVHFSAMLIPPIILIPLIIIFVGCALWLTLAPVTRKACHLAEVTRKFSEGELNARVRLDGEGPVEQIARIFNQAADHVAGLLKARDRLFQAVSHELRTPISRLFFLLDMIEEAQDTVSRRELIIEAGENLSELTEATNALLDYTRFTGKNFRFDENEVNLNDLIHQTLRESLEIKTSIEFKQPTYHVMLVGDQKRLKTVITNLLHNADRHAKSLISISIHPSLSEEGQHELWIEDDGDGIPEGMHERIFDAFERADESRNRDQGGAGLGLSIARSIINGHQGLIRAENAESGGARFIISLPKKRKNLQSSSRFTMNA